MLKYIIFDKHDIPMIVIFDCLQQHVDIRNKINLPVISAGKFSWNTHGKLHCDSGSVSLGIKSNLEQSIADEWTINKMMAYN